jgi:UDP-N-acetylglucosamine 3-dehydrogenase
MGQNHARIYSEIGDLVGVYDAIPETAHKVAKRLNTSSYGSVDDLLGDVDAVSVCTPTTTHFLTARTAIKRGKAVLVEKPFTGEEEQARMLCQLAEENDVTIASGFVERFNPVVKATKDIFEAGKMGRLVSISSRRVSSFPARVRDVGVIKDLAIHDIDVIRYITGLEVRSVYTLAGKMNGLPFEDHANLMLKLGDTVNATVEVNWLTPMKVRRVAMTCSRGFAEMDYTDQSLQLSTSTHENVDSTNLSQIPMELNTQHMYVKKEEPLRMELEAFVQAAGSNSKAAVDGWDALSNLRVCNAALRSLATEHQVDIEYNLDTEVEVDETVYNGSTLLYRR